MGFKTEVKRPIADLTGKIHFQGKTKKSIERVYESMAPRSRRLINPRTGQPFTILGPLTYVSGEGWDHSAYCSFTRLAVAGNYPNDVEEFVAKQSGDKNIRVFCELRRVVRNERREI